MIKIGITGGIATGKSTVTSYLRQRGYPVIDADEGARAVVVPDSKGLKAIEAQFGEQIIQADGQLDREALGKLIFRDEEKRALLNQILHPLIFEWIEAQIEAQIKQDKTEILFVDMPLLFEVGYQSHLDQVWLVYTSHSTQLARLMARNQLSEEEAIQRIDSQMSLEVKKELANVTINNEGDLNQLYQQVDQLLTKLSNSVI